MQCRGKFTKNIKRWVARLIRTNVEVSNFMKNPRKMVLRSVFFERVDRSMGYIYIYSRKNRVTGKMARNERRFTRQQIIDRVAMIERTIYLLSESRGGKNNDKTLTFPEPLELHKRTPAAWILYSLSSCSCCPWIFLPAKWTKHYTLGLSFINVEKKPYFYYGI